MSAEVLISGFEPFGGDSRNPSSEACMALDGHEVEGCRVRALCLPTAFGAAAKVLLREIARNRPQLVIATGVAAVIGGTDDVGQRDRGGLACQRVAATGTAQARDQTAAAQAAEQQVEVGRRHLLPRADR